MERLDSLEERMSHLIRAVEDLSDVVAAQAREIDTLTRRVQMLMEREAEREAEIAVLSARLEPLRDELNFGAHR